MYVCIYTHMFVWYASGNVSCSSFVVTVAENDMDDDELVVFFIFFNFFMLYKIIRS